MILRFWFNALSRIFLFYASPRVLRARAICARARYTLSHNFFVPRPPRSKPATHFFFLRSRQIRLPATHFFCSPVCVLPYSQPHAPYFFVRAIRAPFICLTFCAFCHALNALGAFCSLIICAPLFARPRSIHCIHKPRHPSTPRVFFVAPIRAPVLRVRLKF